MKVSSKDLKTIKLCIASAWLHGSISAGRVHELEKSLDMAIGEIGKLKVIEAWHVEQETKQKGAVDDQA